MVLRGCVVRLVAVGVGLLGGVQAMAGIGAPVVSPAKVEPVLSGLAVSNPFDPARKPWPDVVPPVPPIPAPVPVTDLDLQVYGVVAVGPVRKAYFKLGPRFSGVPVGANGFAAVSQGGSVGEFVLAEVQVDQVLLQAPGGQQWVRFSSKKDRSAAPMPVVPRPAVVAGPSPQQGAAQQPSVAGGAVLAMPAALTTAPGAAGPSMATSAQPTSPNPGQSSLGGVGSLAAAIAAAQANAQAQAQSPSPVVPSGTAAAMSNPFLQLLQNAPKR